MKDNPTNPPAQGNPNEAPKVAPALLYGDSSGDLVPYPTTPLSPKAAREKVAADHKQSQARPASHLPPGRQRDRARARAATPPAQGTTVEAAPTADQPDQVPAPKRFSWQHETDVQRTPAPAPCVNGTRGRMR